MSKNQKVVKIIEVQSEEVLWSGGMEQMAEAYEYAAKLEDMGLDIRLDSPTVTQSLAQNLGLNASEKEEYEQSLFDEIHDHEGSCCTKESGKD